MNRLLRLIILITTGATGVATVLRAAPVPAVNAFDAQQRELEALLASIQPTWTASATLSTAMGYRSNVLLSPSQTIDRPFLRSGLETLLWHVPKARIDYFGFLNAEYTRYLKKATDSFQQSIDHEAEAFAGLEWRFRQKDLFSFTLDGQGYYLDQLFDVSNLIAKTSVQELKVKGAKLGPTVRWSPLQWAWIETNGMIDRQRFADGLNDAKIREATLRLGIKPLERLELSIAGTERRRAFDRRQPVAEDGPVPGLLAIREWEVEGVGTVTWGHGWTSISRAGELRYADNALGYLNYHQRHAAQEVEWSLEKWLVRVEGEARRREYQSQTVGFGTHFTKLVKEDFTATARIERTLSSRWAIFVEGTWERSRSNDPIASYRMKEGLLGARWSWEK